MREYKFIHFLETSIERVIAYTSNDYLVVTSTVGGEVIAYHVTLHDREGFLYYQCVILVYADTYLIGFCIESNGKIGGLLIPFGRGKWGEISWC